MPISEELSEKYYATRQPQMYPWFWRPHYIKEIMAFHESIDVAIDVFTIFFNKNVELKWCKKTSATENWTRVSCVTGRDNSHYTIADPLIVWDEINWNIVNSSFDMINLFNRYFWWLANSTHMLSVFLKTCTITLIEISS